MTIDDTPDDHLDHAQHHLDASDMGAPDEPVDEVAEHQAGDDEAAGPDLINPAVGEPAAGLEFPDDDISPEAPAGGVPEANELWQGQADLNDWLGDDQSVAPDLDVDPGSAPPRDDLLSDALHGDQPAEGGGDIAERVLRDRL